MLFSERAKTLSAALTAINILNTNFGAAAFNTILEGVKNGAIKDPVKTAEDFKKVAEILGVSLEPANQEAIQQIREAMDTSRQRPLQCRADAPQSCGEDKPDESASHPRKFPPIDE